MAGRLLHDPDQDGWERSDFPIVCETCLGPNPFVRMQKVEYGGACHISGRPYTVFRWRPGSDARYKKTIICQDVAKAKNVCQVCLLDLDYNLPVQVRDKALGIENEDLPQSDVGKEYQLNERFKAGDTQSSFADARPNDTILRLQRTTPYYKRNEARVCSFFARGQCTRGAECPYRHEMPISGDLANQNIKDRYYGVNDPVANKMMRRLDETTPLLPPEDKSITTLFVGGVTPEIDVEELKRAFGEFAEVTAVKVVPSKACAFVTLSSRAQAEKAAEKLHGKLLIQGQRLQLMWGRPPASSTTAAAAAASTSGATEAQAQAEAPSGSDRQDLPPAQGLMSAPGPSTSQYGAPPNFFNLPPQERTFYPSMDPTSLGTRIPAPSDSKRGPEGAAPEPHDLKRARAHDFPGPSGSGGSDEHGNPRPGMYPPGLPPPPMMFMRPPMPYPNMPPGPGYPGPPGAAHQYGQQPPS